MIRTYIDSLEPGMQIARSIFNDDGTMLLGTDVILDIFLIRRLKAKGIVSVYIQDEATEDIVLKETIPQMVRGSTINDLKKVHDSLNSVKHEMKRFSYWSAKELIESKKFKAVFGDSQMLTNIQKSSRSIVDELMLNEVSLGLNSIKTYGNYHFEHAVDVAVFSIMLGKKLQLPEKRLRELGVGCLLHDIGMTLLPKSIVEKEGELTLDEKEQIKLHPEIGYELFRDVSSIGVLPPHIAFQHHEHHDGSGYPRELQGTDKIELQNAPRRIHLFASICTLADIYDALVSDRPYRPAYPTERVLEIMLGMKNTILHGKILDVFLSFAPPFPVGTSIRVSGREFNGYTGLVKELNHEDIRRPTIRLIYNDDDKRINPFEINLLERNDLLIASTIR